MTAYIRPERDSHWYYPDGTPCHALPNKSKPGELRPTTVADAKKLGLLPSVTNILDVVHRYVLEAWKANQLVLAALHNPRMAGEEDASYADRIIEYASAPATEAAGFGTRFHAAVRDFLHGYGVEAPAVDPEVRPFYDAFLAWYRQRGFEPITFEHPFARPDLGFGGTVDLVAMSGRQVVIDWTTTRNPDMPVYPEKLTQVVAYRYGMEVCEGGVAVVVMSSLTPGLIKVCELHETQLEPYWRGFLAARDLFYSPMAKGRELSYGSAS